MKTIKILAYLFIIVVMYSLYYLTVSQFPAKGSSSTVALAVVLSMIVYLVALPIMITSYLDKLIAKHEDTIIHRAKKKAVDDFMDFLIAHGDENQTFSHDVLNKEIPIRDGQGRLCGTSTVYQKIDELSNRFINDIN